MIRIEALDIIYRDTIQDLKSLIEVHVCPNGKSSIKAFAEFYGIDRSNLNKCLNGTNGQELSVGVFQRCCLALGLMHQNQVYDCKALMNLSLKSYLMIDNNAIKDSILMINTGLK
jgi:hypothetical protein